MRVTQHPSRLAIGGIESGAGASLVAARFSGVRNQAPVRRTQILVLARPRIGARREALRLRIFALLQAYLRKLVP